MEKMTSTEEKKKLCICGSCPAYNDCANEKKELLYCATGKSPDCITEEISDTACICPQCPMTPMMNLKNIWFCTRGSEKEQS